jgi:agmatine/peptidylarginine deiminase
MKRNTLSLVSFITVLFMNCSANYAGKAGYYHYGKTEILIPVSPDTMLIRPVPAGIPSNLLHLKDFVETPPPPQPARQPAEFEPMQGVLIRYPFGISLSLIAEMSEDAEVVTIVSDVAEKNYVTSLYSNNGVDTAHCNFLIVPNTECFYTRDYGPWFIFTGDNQQGIIDFVYNRPTRPISDGVPVDFGNEFGIPVFGMNLIHTGGNYMTDGLGVAASTDLVLSENPTLNQEQVNQKVHDYLGINAYYLPPDIYTNGIMHIDCWAKFLSPDKIMIRQVPEWHSAYNEIEARVQYFSSQISSYGTPYKIFRVYTPDDEAYTNALILNKKVLIPLWNTQWDDDAIASWQQAMPGYEVLGFTGSWSSNDALHCRTMGITDRNMLYIKHIPLHDTETANVNLPLGAIIHPYSGHGLIADSLLVYWRNTGGNWNVLQLQQAAPDSFYTFIPMQELGSTVEYYIHAADSSGKSENHPYVGSAAPHKFNVGLDITPPDIVHAALPGECPAGITFNFSAWAWDQNGVQSVTLEYIIGDVTQIPVDITLTSLHTYTLSVTPPVITGDTIRYRIRAIDNSNQHNTGYFPSSGYIEIAIVPTIPVLVLDPSNTSGQVIASCIDSIGIQNDLFSDLSGVNIYNYTTIFICLGVYSNNYILSAAEANMILDYINSGGKVYMEGSDCWAFDNSGNILNQAFHVDPVDDGDDLPSPITGQAGTLTEGLVYDYNGDNSYMDIISNLTGADLVFTTGTGDGRGVAYNHKTVGFSFELAGLVDAAFPSTRKELVRRILGYFGVWPEGINNLPKENLSVRIIPNPSAGNVNVQYNLSAPGNVIISLYDSYGRLIMEWKPGRQTAGTHSVNWNRTTSNNNMTSPGTCFIKIAVDDKIIAFERIVLVR